MELTDDLKGLLIETAKQLKGGDRRLFLARTVKALGPGGASRAERELGWIRKGIHEVESSIRDQQRLKRESYNVYLTEF